jgi:hypothetical protein
MVESFKRADDAWAKQEKEFAFGVEEDEEEEDQE